MLHVDPTSLAVDAPAAPATGVERARALMEQQIDMLTRLAEIGIARAAEPVEPPERADLAYSRIARAVRLTLALQSRLIKDLVALEHGVPPKAEARPAPVAKPEPDPAELRDERAGRIDRIVRRIIEDTERFKEDIQRLSREAWERLEDEDVYGDLLSRPMGEIVALICEDLGLKPDWDRLAKEAWAVEEARAAPPGSPFAAKAAAASSTDPVWPPPRCGPD